MLCLLSKRSPSTLLEVRVFIVQGGGRRVTSQNGEVSRLIVVHSFCLHAEVSRLGAIGGRPICAIHTDEKEAD